MLVIDDRLIDVDTDADIIANFNRILSLYDTIGESVADLEDSQLYKVTFDSDGGSEVSNQYIIEGDKVQEPTDPTKEGYVFDKWLNGEEEYDFDEPVKGHLSLKASWTEEESNNEENSGQE